MPLMTNIVDYLAVAPLLYPEPLPMAMYATGCNIAGGGGGGGGLAFRRGCELRHVGEMSALRFLGQDRDVSCMLQEGMFISFGATFGVLRVYTLNPKPLTLNPKPNTSLFGLSATGLLIFATSSLVCATFLAPWLSWGCGPRSFHDVIGAGYFTLGPFWLTKILLQIQG